MQVPEISNESVSAVLDKYHVVAKISENEHLKLKEAGLDSKMPENWDGQNKFARYDAVGIKIVYSDS